MLVVVVKRVLVLLCEGCEADRSCGRPVALQKELQTLTGISQVTVADHQGIGALRNNRDVGVNMEQR